jgi:hypothetical protein
VDLDAPRYDRSTIGEWRFSAHGRALLVDGRVR